MKEYIDILPPMFNTWFELYKYISKENLEVRFGKLDSVKVIFRKELYFFSVNFLKAKALDEIIVNLPTREQIYVLSKMDRQEYPSSKYLREILVQLEKITVKN